MVCVFVSVPNSHAENLIPDVTASGGWRLWEDGALTRAISALIKEAP